MIKKNIIGANKPIKVDDPRNWYYRDSSGKIQGPFNSNKMSEWYNLGYFKLDLCVNFMNGLDSLNKELYPLGKWFTEGNALFLEKVPIIKTNNFHPATANQVVPPTVVNKANTGTRWNYANTIAGNVGTDTLYRNAPNQQNYQSQYNPSNVVYHQNIAEQGRQQPQQPQPQQVVNNYNQFVPPANQQTYLEAKPMMQLVSDIPTVIAQSGANDWLNDDGESFQLTAQQQYKQQQILQAERLRQEQIAKERARAAEAISAVSHVQPQYNPDPLVTEPVSKEAVESMQKLKKQQENQVKKVIAAKKKPKKIISTKINPWKVKSQTKSFSTIQKEEAKKNVVNPKAKVSNNNGPWNNISTNNVSNFDQIQEEEIEKVKQNSKEKKSSKKYTMG